MSFWTRERVVDLAVKIDGWMDRDELGWLYDRAREIPKGGAWVEVGCWKGRSFFATAMGLPYPSEFHAVDPWCGDDSSEAHWEARELPGWILANFRASIKGLQAARVHNRPEVIIHHDPLRVMIHKLPEIDAAFLDGLHDHRSVCLDIDLIWKKLKPGGLLAGHDFHLESVQRAVNERFTSCEIGPRNIWHVRKKDAP